MSQAKAETDAETAARVQRSTAFIKWLWLHLDGDEARRTVILHSVLDRMHEVRLDALLDALAIAQNVLDLRPASEEMQATVRALSEYADAQRQVVEKASDDALS